MIPYTNRINIIRYVRNAFGEEAKYRIDKPIGSFKFSQDKQQALIMLSHQQKNIKETVKKQILSESALKRKQEIRMALARQAEEQKKIRDSIRNLQ